MRSCLNYLACLALLLLACNADVRSGVHPGGGDPMEDMGSPDLAPPCPEGEHLLGDTCLPNGLDCAAEFPCENGLRCLGGRCVSFPGPCKTNDDCPTGYVCQMGNCAPVCPTKNPQCKMDADCGPAHVCIGCLCVDVEQCKDPTADIDGPSFAVRQNLHLDEALGQFGQVFAGIMKKLRDGILNCPNGSGNDCFLFQLIAKALPNWARVVILAVGNLADVLDNHNFFVRSDMLFSKSMGRPQGYAGMDHWTEVSFVYQNMFISAAPEKIPQIGKPVFVPFDSSLICGVLYVDKHVVQGVLSGILHWIVDMVVEFETCGQGMGICFHTLSDAIDAGINCNLVNDPNAKKACLDFRNGLKQTIDTALNLFVVNYSLMTLKGTALVDKPAKTLQNGQWEGTLGDGLKLFKDFTGIWSGSR